MLHDTQETLPVLDVDCHNCIAPLNESLDKPSISSPRDPCLSWFPVERGNRRFNNRTKQRAKVIRVSQI